MCVNVADDFQGPKKRQGIVFDLIFIGPPSKPGASAVDMFDFRERPSRAAIGIALSAALRCGLRLFVTSPARVELAFCFLYVYTRVCERFVCATVLLLSTGDGFRPGVVWAVVGL